MGKKWQFNKQLYNKAAVFTSCQTDHFYRINFQAITLHIYFLEIES